MRYNAAPYNTNEYNINAFSLNFSETISEADTIAKSMSVTRTESQASADVLSDAHSLTAFMETVSILQRATYGAVYNSFGYNGAMYNRTVDNDEILLQVTKALSDSLGFTDTFSATGFIKGLFDTMTETDAILFNTGPMLNDFVFLSEFIRIEITNKAINETIRLADWLTIKRKSTDNEWYD